MEAGLGTLIRYHRYRSGSFLAIGGLLFNMLLIPALLLRGELWQRALMIAFGLALSSPFFIHVCRKRGATVALFEDAILFSSRTTGTKIIRWENVKTFTTDNTNASTRCWLTTKSGDRLLVNGGPITRMRGRCQLVNLFSTGMDP